MQNSVNYCSSIQHRGQSLLGRSRLEYTKQGFIQIKGYITLTPNGNLIVFKVTLICQKIVENNLS